MPRRRTAASGVRRPRPFFLVALAVAVGAALLVGIAIPLARSTARSVRLREVREDLLRNPTSAATAEVLMRLEQTQGSIGALAQFPEPREASIVTDESSASLALLALRVGRTRGPVAVQELLRAEQDDPAKVFAVLSAAADKAQVLATTGPATLGKESVLTIVYGVCAVTDAVAKTEAGAWLAKDLVLVRHRALSSARACHTAPAADSRLASELDRLLLAQNQVYQETEMPSEDAADDELTMELLRDPDPKVRSAAAARLKTRSTVQRQRALERCLETAEPLRSAMLAEGLPDPRLVPEPSLPSPPLGGTTAPPPPAPPPAKGSPSVADLLRGQPR